LYLSFIQKFDLGNPWGGRRSGTEE